MNKKLNPAEAPPGYVAVAASGCDGCAFRHKESGCVAPEGVACSGPFRGDGVTAIFIKRPAEPAPLDARYSQRMPAATKAKAMRIGGAAVIAAIEAVEEGGAA